MKPMPFLQVSCLAVCFCLLSACGKAPEDEIGADAPHTITVTSTAFENGTRIPDQHTCEGVDTAPHIAWSNLPEGTQSIVLISTDYDAPSPHFRLLEIVHWIAANIPPETRALPEGFSKVRLNEDGIYQGNKTGGGIGYYGPCPPFGEHTYYFVVYALDMMLDLPSADMPKAEVLELMQGHILARGILSGTYSR